MKKILLMLVIAGTMFACTTSEPVDQTFKTTDTSVEAKITDTQATIDAIKFVVNENPDVFTEAEITAGRACIQSSGGYVFGLQSGVYYVVCVTIGKKSFTVTLQYPGGGDAYTGSAVADSCSC